jgi:hypothetical protein
MNAAWHIENAKWAEPIGLARDKRILGMPVIERCSMNALLVWTKDRLSAVARAGVDVNSLVQMTGKPNAERVLVCGTRGGTQFVRSDGVACNFRIVVVENGNSLALCSYAFHVDSPDQAIPPFLRWEFSFERKPNVSATREPLAHMHPGHDQVRLPAPVLSPKELITCFLAVEF